MKVSQSDLLHLFAPPSVEVKASLPENTPEMSPKANRVGAVLEEPGPAATGPDAAIVHVAVPEGREPDQNGQSAGPKAAGLSASGTQDYPAGALPERTSPPVTADGHFTPLHRELASALPALWSKAKKQNLSRAEERKKLRALIAWLVAKKAMQSQESAPMRYRQAGQTVDGKIDLLVKDLKGVSMLAVEADWALQEASLAKLKAAHDRNIPVLWVLGTPARSRQDAKEARKFAVRLLGPSAGSWLVIFHLEHGWL